MKRVSLLDQQALGLYKDIRKAFYDLKDQSNPHGNIFGVFFHDLMIHFSGILMLREWGTDYGSDFQFPFANQSYANAPFELSDSKMFGNISRHSLKLAAKNHGLLPVAFGRAISWGYKEHQIIGKVFSLTARYREAERLYLVDRRRQIACALDLVKQLCNDYGLSNENYVIRNWEKYLKELTTNGQKSIREKKVIIGTRGILQNRILAANFLQQEKEVVGFTHGEINNAVFDEPFFGYSERTFCSVLVEYGSDKQGGKWNEPLTKPKRVEFRSSAVIKKIYIKDENIQRRELGKHTSLYIPTMYVGNLVYGPFRSHEDKFYMAWQNCLVSAIPLLTVKSHPKSKVATNHFRYEKRPLEDCYKDYDLLILDYFSTAMTVSLFSRKPIIFFNIGLRNMTEEFMTIVKNRCLYVEIDVQEDIREQIIQGLNKYANFSGVWSNVELERLSLNGESKMELSRRLLQLIF